jgi:hypothetical protein
MRNARLIAVAWGEPYLRELLEVSLPAVLAPGNLPALAAELECEVALLTEERFFDRIRQHAVVRELERHCRIKLLAIDDLIAAPLYGLALTHALYRGFEDLGARVTQTALLFINSDWILADGSYRSLLNHLRGGARLINAPSYCVVAERVAPEIRSRLERGNGILSIPSREMAALAIRHRHNTIRGKTLNRKLFHMDVVDQFYWLVDPATMLCHQMPVAVVCMVPEFVPAAPKSFWDYGITLELCPTTRPVVLADSDEFLMIELRGEDTYSEGLRMGWPTLEQVGRQLATFVTQDQLDFAGHQLCLHANDLPANVEQARRELAAGVRTALAQIGRPKSYEAHSYWWSQKALFDAARRDFATREVVGKWRWGFRASPYTSILLAEVDRVERATLSRRDAGAPADLAAELAALGASIGQLEGLFASDLHVLRKTIRERLHRWNAPSIGRAPSTGSASAAPARPLDFLTRPHPLHPDRVAASPLSDELARRPDAAAAGSVVISSAGRDLALRALRARGIEPRQAGVDDAIAAFQEPCRLAVLDLDHADLPSFRTLCRAMLPRVADGGAILLLHENRRGPLLLDPWTILNVFPVSDRVTVRYAGSRWSHLATGIHDRVRRLLRGSRGSALLALAAAAPAAFIASVAGGKSSSAGDASLPPSCASMLLVLPVDAAVRTELADW